MNSKEISKLKTGTILYGLDFDATFDYENREDIRTMEDEDIEQYFTEYMVVGTDAGPMAVRVGGVMEDVNIESATMKTNREMICVYDIEENQLHQTKRAAVLQEIEHGKKMSGMYCESYCRLRDYLGDEGGEV